MRVSSDDSLVSRIRDFEKRAHHFFKKVHMQFVRDGMRVGRVWTLSVTWGNNQCGAVEGEGGVYFWEIGERQEEEVLEIEMNIQIY